MAERSVGFQCLAPGKFDKRLQFFDESLPCFVVLYSSTRELPPELFPLCFYFFFFHFICHAMKLMLRPRLMMNAGPKSTHSAAFRTNGAFGKKKKKDLSPLLLLIYLIR